MVTKVNAASVPRSEKILGRATCLASDAIGNCVRISAPKTGHIYNVETVDISTSGSPPAVAIVIKKYSATDCAVQFHGPMRAIYTGLNSGVAYLVGTDGRISSIGDANYPVSGSDFFQFIGVATSDNELLVHPLAATFGGLFSGARFFQQPLSPTVDPQIFTSALKFMHGAVDAEVVYYNGQRLLEGTGNDYIAVESGGIGTGYDTISLTFVPRPGSNWLIDYTPDV